MSYFTSLVSHVADWASIISLFVSGYAAYAITKVRSEVVARIRLPSFVEALERHGKNFSTLMLTYDETTTKEQFSLELAKCEANLRHIKYKIGRAEGLRVTALLRRIARYKAPSLFGYYPVANTRDDAWSIYADLNGLIEALRQLAEEHRMGA